MSIESSACQDRPAPFSVYTTIEMWNDPHISEHLLRHHLDSADHLCSRPHEFIDRSVRWIVDRFKIGRGTTILDLGCGPGLYAIRLARLGARVVGIDASERSISYAREAASAEGLEISYLCGSYLELDPPRDITLALLIYRDYCALSPDRRHSLLEKVREALTPGGALLFDVTGTRVYADRKEESFEAENFMDGLWASGPYLAKKTTYLYPDRRLVLDRFEIVEAHRTRLFYDWCQCLTPEEIAEELAAAGLHIEEVLGSVAGDSIGPESWEFTVVARRDSFG